jgi:mono/diheme cytochrome c family protein
VQEWCSMCHGVERRQPEAMDVPAFAEVAARPGRDLDYLRAFLDGDHFPMTTHRLFPDERDDVAAFIDSLRPR